MSNVRLKCTNVGIFVRLLSNVKRALFYPRTSLHTTNQYVGKQVGNGTSSMSAIFRGRAQVQ